MASHEIKDYKIGSLLGSGKFSSTYIAREVVSNKEFALKVFNLDDKVQNQDHILLKVAHEWLISSKVGGNYAIKSVLLGRSHNFVYMAMDYYPSTFPLRNIMRQHTAAHNYIGMDLLRLYVLGIATAIIHVHKQHIIFRDLRPEHVLVDNKGNIRLCGFSSAKADISSWSGQTSSLCGRAQYTAPEIILGNEPYGLSCDWWSLGVILYEFLSGYLPFTGSSYEEVKESLIGSPTYLLDSWDLSTKDVVMKLLSKNPAKRIGSQQNGAEVCSHAFFFGIQLPKPYTHGRDHEPAATTAAATAAATAIPNHAAMQPATRPPPPTLSGSFYSAPTSTASTSPSAACSARSSVSSWDLEGEWDGGGDGDGSGRAKCKRVRIDNGASDAGKRQRQHQDQGGNGDGKDDGIDCSSSPTDICSAFSSPYFDSSDFEGLI